MGFLNRLVLVQMVLDDKPKMLDDERKMLDDISKKLDD